MWDGQGLPTGPLYQEQALAWGFPYALDHDQQARTHAARCGTPPRAKRFPDIAPRCAARRGAGSVGPGSDPRHVACRMQKTGAGAGGGGVIRHVTDRLLSRSTATAYRVLPRAAAIRIGSGPASLRAAWERAPSYEHASNGASMSVMTLEGTELKMLSCLQFRQALCLPPQGLDSNPSFLKRTLRTANIHTSMRQCGYFVTLAGRDRPATMKSPPGARTRCPVAAQTILCRGFVVRQALGDEHCSLSDYPAISRQHPINTTTESFCTLKVSDRAYRRPDREKLDESNNEGNRWEWGRETGHQSTLVIHRKPYEQPQG
jgi:hypothetical protein